MTRSREVVGLDAHRGKEYSCRNLAWAVNGALQQGMDESALFDGITVARDELLDVHNWIDWSTVVRLFDNMAANLTDDQLREVGAYAIKAMEVRAIRIMARLLYSTSQLYKYSAEHLMTSHISCLRGTCVEIARGHVLVETRLLEGYPASHGFNTALSGQLSIYPLVYDKPRAHVEFTENDAGAVFDITFTEAGGRLSRLRSPFKLVRAARAAGEELRVAYDVMVRRNTDLEREMRARARAEDSLQRIRTDEQTRIRRELHDAVGQKLTGIGYLANALARDLDSAAPEQAAIAQQLAQSCQDTLDELHAILHRLAPVDFGTASLASAIEAMAALVSAETGVAIDVDATENLPTLPTDACLHLYRIAQEATTNAARHSGAEAIMIVVEYNPEERRIELVVEDDGNGSPEQLHTTSGFGLRIIRERAELLGGTVSFESRPPHGLKVRCAVPDQPENE